MLPPLSRWRLCACQTWLLLLRPTLVLVRCLPNVRFTPRKRTLIDHLNVRFVPKADTVIRWPYGAADAIKPSVLPERGHSAANFVLLSAASSAHDGRRALGFIRQSFRQWPANYMYTKDKARSQIFKRACCNARVLCLSFHCNRHIRILFAE